MERISALHYILLCITLQLNLSLKRLHSSMQAWNFWSQQISVLIVFTYETKIRVILIQYVLENTICQCRYTNFPMLTEYLSPSPITGCCRLSVCTDLLFSVHTVACSLPEAHLGKLLRSWRWDLQVLSAFSRRVKKQSWGVNITSNECPISHRNASLGFLYSSFHGYEENKLGFVLGFCYLFVECLLYLLMPYPSPQHHCYGCTQTLLVCCLLLICC